VVKLLKYIVVFTLFGMLISGIAYAAEGDVSLGESGSIQNYAYINQLLLESSRYTQTDESDLEILDDYLIKRPKDHYALSGGGDRGFKNRDGRDSHRPYGS